jgi:hypothetical protein
VAQHVRRRSCVCHARSPSTDAADKSFFTVGKWQRAVGPGTYGSFYAYANEGTTTHSVHTRTRTHRGT